jgi:hypothetical protein
MHRTLFPVSQVVYTLHAHGSGHHVARRLADAYGVTDIDGSRPDCWGYIDAYGRERDDGWSIGEFR